MNKYIKRSIKQSLILVFLIKKLQNFNKVLKHKIIFLMHICFIKIKTKWLTFYICFLKYVFEYFFVISYEFFLKNINILWGFLAMSEFICKNLFNRRFLVNNYFKGCVWIISDFRGDFR